MSLCDCELPSPSTGMAPASWFWDRVRAVEGGARRARDFEKKREFKLRCFKLEPPASARLKVSRLAMNGVA